MEHDIDPAHQPPHQAGVADVALFQAHSAGRQHLRQVLPAAADEVVQHDDLAGTRRNELIDDRRADRARSSGDQAALSFYHGVPSVSLLVGM